MIRLTKEECFDDVWERIEEASRTTRAPFRTTNLATVSPEGGPETRLVILRYASKRRRCLSVYSDGAALKCEALKRTSGVAFCFWDPELQLQVRMTGEAFIEESDAGDTNWVSLNSKAQELYRATPKPGTPIPQANAFAYGGETRFARIDCTITSIDILHLGPPNHSRIRAEWKDDNWVLEWVVP